MRQISLPTNLEAWEAFEWRDGGFVVNFGDMDIFDLSDCFGNSYQMWVIGNIHDNPDLIK